MTGFSNRNFILEQENDGSLPFLDVKFFCINGKFITSVYRKPKFSECFTSPIMKFSVQRIKREDLYTYYFIEVLAYVVISKRFTLKLII